MKLFFSIRVIFIFLGVMLLSHYLPYLYWLVMNESISSPYVLYSSLKEKFVFYRFDGKHVVYTDEDQQTYSASEFNQITPLYNFEALAEQGLLPDHLRETKLIPQELEYNRSFVQLQPVYLDTPSFPLYPILRGSPEAGTLGMTEFFIRFKSNKIDLVNANTNTIDSTKSNQFTLELEKAHFQFPAKGVFGNPTTNKPYDEGYFIVDSRNKVFQFQIDSGNAVVKDIATISNSPETWKRIEPDYILVSEQNNHKLRCAIIDTDQNLWLVMGETYTPIQIPLNTYIPHKMRLIINGNLLYTLVSCQTETALEAVVLDKNDQLKDRYYENLQTSVSSWKLNIAHIIFPWITNFEKDNSEFKGVYITSISIHAFILNLFSALLIALINYRKRKWNRGSKLLCCSVLLSGIFGLLAFWLIPCEICSEQKEKHNQL